MILTSYVLSSKKIDSATFNVDEGQARGKESPKSGAPRPNAKPLTVTVNWSNNLWARC